LKVDPTKLRRNLKEEVSKRLKAICYWNFIPIPQATEDKSDPDSTDFEETGSSASVGKVRRREKVTQEKLPF
jgi:hypothetical protein